MRFPQQLIVLFAVALTLMGQRVGSCDENWAQFRGPLMNGVAEDDPNLPDSSWAQRIQGCSGVCFRIQ